MNSKHTPGPWSASVESSGGFSIYPEDSMSTVICDRGPWPHRAQESAANAHLIAAAPDLLEALKAVFADVKEYERINNLAPNPGWQDCWASMTHARAAIAKAEGAS